MSIFLNILNMFSTLCLIWMFCHPAECRYTSPYCALLYCISQMLTFLRIEGKSIHHQKDYDTFFCDGLDWTHNYHRVTCKGLLCKMQQRCESKNLKMLCADALNREVYRSTTVPGIEWVCNKYWLVEWLARWSTECHSLHQMINFPFRIRNGNQFMFDFKNAHFWLVPDSWPSQPWTGQPRISLYLLKGKRKFHLLSLLHPQLLLEQTVLTN